MRTRPIVDALWPKICSAHRGSQTIGAMLLACIISVTQPSQAQDEAAVNDARELLAQGLSAFNAGHFGEALDKYTRAFSIMKLPALAVHMARADVKLGRFVAAADLYQEATQLGDGVGVPTAQSRARGEAQVERSALLLRIPKLLIRIVGVEPNAVTVQVDGATFPSESYESGWLVDPGTHKVTASFGNQQQAQMAAMTEGEARELRFEFKSGPQHEANLIHSSSAKDTLGGSSALRNAAWVSLGVGGAGLLVWGTAGLVALGKSNHLKSENCGRQPSDPTCPADEEANYARWRTTAAVGFYTGVAGLITGAALYLAEPSKKKTRDSNARVLPWLGVGSAGVEGSF